MADSYFKADADRLFWAIATRRQLERWERALASYLVNEIRHERDPADTWLVRVEHHFVLLAARHLLTALEDLSPPPTVAVDETLRNELKEGRDLHEHWIENMPIFNVRPRVEQPRHRSGQSFAERNPERGPYWWLGWRSDTGAWLLPHVTAAAVHELLDAVEAEVLTHDDSLSRFVTPRAQSPWVYDRGVWWPKSGS